MKKRLIQLACAVFFLLPCELKAAGDSVVQLQFELSGSDVSVNVVDETGTPMDGVTATLSSASHSFSAPKGAITASMLSPNVNFNTDPEVNLTFTIQGLSDNFQFNTVGLDVHALNSTGAYQENNDGQQRLFNFAIASGSSSSTLEAFATLSNTDIAAGVGEKGNVHKVWDITSSSTHNATNPLVISITVTKGSTNRGCFMGLTSITLSQSENAPSDPGEPGDGTFPTPNAYYYLKGNGSNTQYMAESTDGSLAVSAPDVSQYQFWQFVPTGNENCYYIKNATTGHFVQSCSMGGSTPIVTGTAPVEYYIGQNGTKYRFTSTDCSNYADTGRSPFGLNKDGSSGKVVSYQAGASNANSWWEAIPTDYLYEVRPFEPSAALGQPEFLYNIRSTKGLSLSMSETGNLTWEEEAGSDNQTWYFVGTSNHEGGYLIVNKATAQTINRENEEQTRWSIFESADHAAYFFKPYGAGDADKALTIDGDSLLLFATSRSDFARSVQIYELPCGALGNQYITKADISGESVLRPMTYPLPTISGNVIQDPVAPRPSSWYTLFTSDKATLAQGTTFTLALQLNAAPLTGTELYIYFDWNRDGLFEERHPLTAEQAMTFTFSVPENAPTGKSRMRIRLTENGLAGAEDDVIGQTLDFVLYVCEPTTDFPLSISSCNEERGSVKWSGNDQLPAEITATATSKGNAQFLYWRDGNRIVSTDAIYTFLHDHAIQLVAYFTPNTSSSTAIGNISGGNDSKVNITQQGNYIYVDTHDKQLTVTVYSADGKTALQSSANRISTANLASGTYIVHAITGSANEGVAKIIVNNDSK